MSYSEEILEEIDDVIYDFIEKGVEFLKMIKSPDDILESLSGWERKSIGFQLITVRQIIESINANLNSFNNKLK